MGGGKFCRYRPNELGDDLRTRKKEEGVFRNWVQYDPEADEEEAHRLTMDGKREELDRKVKEKEEELARKEKEVEELKKKVEEERLKKEKEAEEERLRMEKEMADKKEKERAKKEKLKNLQQQLGKVMEELDESAVAK